MIHKFLKRWRRGYYRLCVHRSHHLRLPCYRLQTYDHQCSKHNGTCFNACRPLVEAIECVLLDHQDQLSGDEVDANLSELAYVYEQLTGWTVADNAEQDGDER